MSHHQLAQIAQTGYAPAAAYDTHRPAYPLEAVERLLEALEIKGKSHAKIIDLAAGTGKFTEALSARPEVYEIIAIEPHDGMRAQLQRKNLRNVTVVAGRAESMTEIGDGSVDALVASQSFHWFANREALQEIHRVLKPTGVFGMIWNIDDYNTPKSWKPHPGWETSIRDLTWSFEDDVPRFREDRWREVFENQTRTNPITIHFSDPLFSLPLGEAKFPFENWLTKDEIWNRYRTLSQVAVLEGDELEKVRKTLFDALDSADTQTDGEGRIAVHANTYLAWTTQIPSEPLKPSK